MDWDLKTPSPWEILPLSNLTLPSKPRPHTPSPLSPPPSPNPLDLKLSTPSPAAKRARNGSPGAGQLAARCLVVGCRADLAECREYHKRHKVCELHSKSPVVTVAGLEQRFCQQCSRFHLLVEFDDAKRSCRKRLEGHNRRRRKPPTDNFINSRGFFANHQGSRFGSYFPPIRPGSNNNFPNMALKPEPISFSSLYPKLRRQFQFPFSQDEIETLNPNCSAFTNCALSLLSSPVQSSPVQSSCSIISTGTGTNYDNISMASPLVPAFQFGNSSSSELFSGFGTGVSSFGGTGEMSGSFEGLSQVSQALPFSWH
ncbi:hypothetical protein LUZ60_015755 [Juncus effusus]|nr:hypothetical protein LUZ60_015755 [Juncus effusus]